MGNEQEILKELKATKTQLASILLLMNEQNKAEEGEKLMSADDVADYLRINRRMLRDNKDEYAFFYANCIELHSSLQLVVKKKFLIEYLKQKEKVHKIETVEII